MTLFDSRDYENNEPVEIAWPKKNPNDFSIDDLMSTNIDALFIKANIDNETDEGVYSVTWQNMLKKEISRLRRSVFSDEAPREVRIQRIQDKITDFRSYSFNNSKAKAETVRDAGADNRAIPKHQTTKRGGRNPRRLEKLICWYADLCTKHGNNSELIIKEINRLTNKKIIEELKKLTSEGDKYIWANGAERWLKDNGATVWGFKKTQGGKRKQI